MKIQSLRSWLALFVFTVSLGLIQTNQSLGQCPSGIAGLSGTVLNSSIQAYPGYQGFPNTAGLAHFLVKVNDNSQPVPQGEYLGWCVDELGDMNADYNYPPNTFYTGLLYPNCDVNLNTEIPPGHTPTTYQSPAVWNQVNYILNHKNGAPFWAVQVAIFDLVGGPAAASPPYPFYDSSVSDGLVAAAQANAASWVPQCGQDVIGVIYVITSQTAGPVIQPTPYQQLLMFEVPYCEVTFSKCPNDMDLGCNPDPKSIPTCQNPVDTNLVFASSCCGYPVTITCSDASDVTLNCMTTRYITYTASDAYGHKATCTQKITWTTDTTVPVVTSPPSGDLGCNPASLPTVDSVKATVTASAGCPGPSTIKVLQQPDAGTPCAMSRTFIITAASACGKESAPTTVVYTWRVDLAGPTITSVPANTNLGCNPAILPTDQTVKAQVQATDSCTLQSIDVTHVDATNGCTVTRTFTITATDACGNKSAPKTVVYTWTADTTGPVVTCPPDITISNSVVPYCTFTPGDYGAACNGTNAASILTNCFNKIYTSGYLQCGITNSTGYCIKFTSCTNVQKFVPSVGNPGCLKTSYSNPTSSCEAGAFAGQALCLKLNVDFSDAKSVTGFPAGWGDLVLNDPTYPLNGKSFRQILGICNTALGGGNVSSYGCTISNLSIICSNLNQSFQNCKPSTWCQSHIVPPAVTNVSPAVTGYATVVDKCNGTPTLTYNDVITAGTCSGTYVIARTWLAVDGCGNTNTCTQKIYVGNSQASICGYVFTDCNGDGFLLPGFDSGTPNVLVTLKNGSNVTVATNKTDSQGAYCFYNVTPGTYTISVAQPTNHVQTAGSCTNHWLDNSGKQCWFDRDSYQHWKGGDGVDCWIASDGYQHWKNSSNKDCWKDKYGTVRTQNCTYVSCDAPKNNVETVTVAPCQALTCVNFAYQGTLPKPAVCVTGPSSGCWGQTVTYTCSLTNTGTACFSACQLTACGKSFNCPSLSPGEGCSFPVNYQFQWNDCGSFKCQATASCNYATSSNPCTAQATCPTSVSGFSWSSLFDNSYGSNNSYGSSDSNWSWSNWSNW